MRRVHLVLCILCLVSHVATAHANPGRVALVDHLTSALQIDDSYDIGYRFEYSVDTLGAQQAGEHDLRMLRHEGHDYFFASLEHPVKVFFGKQQYCREGEAGWSCQFVAADQLAAHARSKQMGLHPLTATYLLHSLVRDYPEAVRVSATGDHYVAGRVCAGFDAVVDPTALPRATFNELLYVNIDSDETAQYVTGTSLQLCFDALSGHMLEYESRLVLDQGAMRRAGFSGAATAAEYGTVRSALTATRYNAFPPNDPQLYQLP